MTLRKKFLLWTVAVLILAPVVYFAFVLNWSYADGERAGWVQKFSNKGWVCKTWEGEMAMVSLPGSVPEKFVFTVRDEQVAKQINDVMGRLKNWFLPPHYGLVALPKSGEYEDHFVPL